MNVSQAVFSHFRVRRTWIILSSIHKKNHCKLTLRSRMETGNTMVRSILHIPEWMSNNAWSQKSYWSVLSGQQRRPSYLTIPHIKACIFSLMSKESQQLSAKETKYLLPVHDVYLSILYKRRTHLSMVTWGLRTIGTDKMTGTNRLPCTLTS